MDWLRGIILFLLLSNVFSESWTGGFTYWPPFTDIDAERYGRAIAVMDELFAHQGVDVEYLQLPWTRVMSGVEDATIDFAAGIWYTERRTELMLFSEPFFTNRIVFISREDAPFEYNQLTSLDNKRIGIIKDYNYNDEFILAENYVPVVTTSLTANIKMVAAGRVDLTLEDEVVARYQISQETPDLLPKLYFSNEALVENGLRVSCNRKNWKCEKFIEGFNTAISEMRASGKLDKLLQQWQLSE